MTVIKIIPSLIDMEVLRNKLMNCEELFHVTGAITAHGAYGYRLECGEWGKYIDIKFFRSYTDTPIHVEVHLIDHEKQVAEEEFEEFRNVDGAFGFIRDFLIKNLPPVPLTSTF